MRRIILGLAAALALSGCSRQQQAEAGSQAQRAKSQTQQAVSKARQQLSDGSITAKVKTAMMASDKLQTGGIDIDTANRVVHLKGSVPDASQKALAERIAKDTVGPDVRVVSDLTVNAKQPAKQTG